MSKEDFAGFVSIDRGNFSKYKDRIQKYYEYLAKDVDNFSDFYWEELVEEAESKYKSLSGITKLFIAEVDYISEYQKKNEHRCEHKFVVHAETVKRWRQAGVLIGCLNDDDISSIQIPLWFNNCMRWFEKKEEEENE